MNENLQKWLEMAKTYFSKFSKGKKILMGASAGVISVAIMVIAVAMHHNPQQILYTDLHTEDSKAIAKKLSELNIPYRLSEDNSTISVASSQVYHARMELAKEGLPGQDVVGFEKFDGSTLGMSSYVQKIQYVRAVQGELTRSIQRLAAVKTARVHISVPPKKTFLEEEDPPKASVILELRPGLAPNKQEINGIAHLVASAVEGLKVNQITIVDTKGNFLHRPEDENNAAASSTLLEMQRSIESEYEKRIEDLLSPVVGFGKVRAKVTAEVDASHSNTTEESYDPEKASPKTTFKTDEEQVGSRPNPMGIPGSRSNLPGAEAQNQGMPMATNNSEKHSSNSNFAIPRKILVTDKPSGNIKRLTVAVVVDGHYNKGSGANATEVFSPRSEEELRRLQDIVGNAVGFDSQRRDSITVSSLPFHNADILPIEEEKPGKFDMQELTKHGVRNGLIGLVILLFFFLVLRPFLKWSSQGDLNKEPPKPHLAVLPKTVAELEAAVQSEQLKDGELPEPEVLALSKKEPEIPEALRDNPEKKEEADLRAKILEHLTNSPKKGFRIVQDWLDEQDPTAAEG